MNYQAIGFGLPMFFARFLPGLLALLIFTGFCTSRDLALILSSYMEDYGLANELWLLFLVLILSYLVGTVLDVVGAGFLDRLYDKAVSSDSRRGVRLLRRVLFLRNEVMCRYDTIKNASHLRISDMYEFDSAIIKEHKLSTYSFCQSAVRASNIHAAYEINLFMGQSKFFRAMSVLLFIFALITASAYIPGGFRCDQIGCSGAMRGIMATALLLFAYFCMLQFSRDRIRATRICYEYYIIIARQGKLDPSPSTLPVTIGS